MANLKFEIADRVRVRHDAIGENPELVGFEGYVVGIEQHKPRVLYLVKLEDHDEPIGFYENELERM